MGNKIYTAEPGPRWVKASERLPEKDGYYCFKANGGYMGAYLRTAANGSRWFCDSAGGTIRNWKNCEWLDEQPAVTSQDAHEKEIMMQAFDKVRQIFEGRQWVMDGRGSYPCNDDRYKEEVRYMYNEFDQVVKDTWANIKSKSIEYREWIISEYLQKDHPAIPDILNRLGYQRIYEQPAAGREEDAVAFVNWTLSSECDTYTCTDEDQWTNIYTQENITTAELYELFKQQKGKQL